MQINVQSVTSTSGTSQAPAFRANHIHSASQSKLPTSPTSSAAIDTVLQKKPHPFQLDNPIPHINPAPKSKDTEVAILLICIVCLSREKHNIPIIMCHAKHTWNNLFNTLYEHVNKSLHIRDTGKIVCSYWQKDSGCIQKHDLKHACSGCFAIMHGASACPRARRPLASNFL